MSSSRTKVYRRETTSVPASFVLLERFRMLKMNQARKCYYRKVKKVEYEIGDLVLACHPALKRGLSIGLSPKYYGPFKIIGKYENRCDYLIKREGHPKSKVMQIFK